MAQLKELEPLKIEIERFVLDYQTRGLASKRTDPAQVAQTYIDAVIADITKYLPHRTEEDRKLNTYRVSLDSISRAVGRFGSRGRQEYWFPILHQHFPIFQVVKRGSLIRGLESYGSLTQIKVLYMIEWTSIGAHTQAEDAKNNPKEYDWVAVDTDSLGEFICQTYTKRYQEQGQNILEVAEYFPIDDRFARLPQRRSPADSGRMYYTGINLQHCPSVLRRAALGEHHGYDLRSSVYAWQIEMLRLDEDLGPYDKPANSSYTRELLTDKVAVRARLAKLLVDTAPELRLPAVKAALTAIGFGARASNTYYNEQGQLVKQGLANSIKMTEDLKRFRADAWVQSFLAEQELIGRRIVEHYKKMNPKLMTKPELMTGNKLSPKKFLAFVYQRFESSVIQAVMAHSDVVNKEVLLWVHDGFYTRKAINLANINGWIMDCFGDGIRLEHSTDTAWVKKAPTEQDVARERAERHRAEANWHRNSGRHTDTEYTECQPLPKWRPAEEVPLGTYLGYK
jgi:hypothetical protein